MPQGYHTCKICNEQVSSRASKSHMDVRHPETKVVKKPLVVQAQELGPDKNLKVATPGPEPVEEDAVDKSALLAISLGLPANTLSSMAFREVDVHRFSCGTSEFMEIRALVIVHGK